MRLLDDLSPKNVFAYFEEFSGIPHGSGNTKIAADWLVEFAKTHSLEFHRDAFNNVIIIREASNGYETIAPVILQGHIDMVCEKESFSDIDFITDGISLELSRDFISAKGTTLGADNGIAVAMMLAVLSDVTLALPRIEAIFSSDEEIGMIGASNIDVSPIKGKRMINIDGDKEGEFITGCAGGNVSVCKLPISRQEYQSDCYRICVKGLKGGHSGIEIDSGRANSNIILARFLKEFSKQAEFRLISFDGGLKDNAIPVFSVAKISTSEYKLLRCMSREFVDSIKSEYSSIDSDIEIEISMCQYDTPMDSKSGKDVIDFVLLAPNGVVDMSKSIPGLVETSLNLGILKTDENNVCFSYCVRSSINAKKVMLCDRLEILCSRFGAEFFIEGDYPAWEFSEDSALVKVFSDSYLEVNGINPNIITIHAGVECGVFSAKIPGLDCISIGPDLYDIHTPQERMSIDSVKRTWDLLIKVLTNIK